MITKTDRRICLTGFFFAFAGLLSSLSAADLNVDLTGPGKSISPDLMGIFYEDLNYAADGGLYAELLQNRSFEYSAVEQPDWGPFESWELIKTGDGTGHWGLGDARPVHVNNEHYLLLTVTEAGEGVGIGNTGFDQIPLEAGKSYKVSFWAYQTFNGIKWGGGEIDQNKPMPVTLQLKAANGNLLAEAKFEVSGRDWTQYSAILTPSQTDTHAQFTLLAHEQGGLALDMISLYPQDTYKGRSNGLRRDLAEAIAEIKPKFMRFPGGCLVHGTGVRHYYDWKKTVGPVEQRKSDHNSWGYHQTYGLGFFEFFQFCEDMGAMPLPVVSAGVCCQHAGDSPGRGQEGLPEEEMPAYIQDVLDLIEWANGSTESEWGAVRAAAGHPEPFGLKYLGVGNEDAITPIFENRFKMIHDAIKESYPDIVIIGTSGPFASGEDYDNGWAFARKVNLELVDEHYYMKPQWFWDNQKRYDSYDRNGPKVYLGEYAAHEPDRRNTLRSAIAEAAGLVSYERNGDIVQFTSYAPLLARRGHTQWTPDMIYFDATEIFLTPNYFTQLLFGQNTGDRFHETLIKGTANDTKLVASTVVDSSSGDIILKIVNGEDSSTNLDVSLEGLSTDHDYIAERIVLSGPNADAVNEDNKDPAVYPIFESVKISADFSYTAPSNSLTIFRIHRR